MKTQKMSSAWYEKQGAAQEVIQYGEMPIPNPGFGEVRVRVHASGVNPSDTKIRSGWGGVPLLFPRIIPHQDGAGVIESVGEGVLSSRIGERVWVYEAQQGRPFGTAAEFVVVPSHQAVLLPEHTSFAEGACIGVSAITAHHCVFADGSVNEQVILVTGGAGSVGYYALQLAKWGGATVITTVSRPQQAQLAQSAGADYIINYKTEDVVQRIQEITQTKRGIDRIIDVDFSAHLPIIDAVLRTNGVVSAYASPNPDAHPALPFLSFMRNGVTIRLVFVYAMPNEAKQAAVRDITAALENGALHHSIARYFHLNEVADAHDAQDSGQMIGKAIINVAACNTNREYDKG
ncbi:NADPH:quinone reductase [Nostoc sp.]|uniref:NADPH:quinone reductase n=1 Tax=Nostoc sp. TaxID=1180 RepID=UPI002FF5CF26